MIGLVFLIALKISAPLSKGTKIFAKGVSIAAEPDHEKEGDSDQYSKNKEYYSVFNSSKHTFFGYTVIAHVSPYKIDYKSSHFYQINTPPPDRS